jgi:hypothetical protein
MFIALTLAAATAAASAAILAPTGTASADSTAATTIGQLEAQGYTVYIDRVGSAPLADCTVTSIRNPYTNYQFIRVGRDPSVLVPVVVSKTIQVSLYCIT